MPLSTITLKGCAGRLTYVSTKPANPQDTAIALNSSLVRARIHKPKYMIGKSGKPCGKTSDPVGPMRLILTFTAGHQMYPITHDSTTIRKEN